MLPVFKAFTITQGSPFLYRFQFMQGVPTSGLPIDLTDAVGQLLIKSGGGATYLTLNSGVATGHTGIFFGGDDADPTSGIIDLVIAAADTTGLSWTYGQYTMALTTELLGLQPILRGTFAVIGSID